MGDQRWKQWCRIVGAVCFCGHRGQFPVLWGEKKYQVMATTSPFWGKHIKSTFFSSLERKTKRKTEKINRYKLAYRDTAKDLSVNWPRAHKTNAGTCLAWCHCAFPSGVISLKMSLFQNVMLYSCYIVSSTKASGTLKTWKTVPTRLEDTARASLFACF